MSEINVNLPASAVWPEIPGYTCRSCGATARAHPQTNQIWGCPACGFTTYSVAVYFAAPWEDGSPSFLAMAMAAGKVGAPC